MGPSNGVSCEIDSFYHHLNPHRFLQPEVLKLYFPVLEHCVVQSVSRCSYWFICTQIWDHLVHQPLPCHPSSPPQLPVSVSPTSLDGYFFFNLLVVSFPYGLIFWRFWLFFLFLKWLLFFFRSGKKVKHIYLCLHLDWK